MKVIEQKTAAKSKRAPCEDEIVVSSHYAGVIDGVTPKNDLRWNGLSTGRMAARIIAEAIRALPEHLELPDVLRNLTRRIFEFYERENFVEQARESPWTRCSASVALYSHSKSKIWLIGDCQCLVDGVHYTNKKRVDAVLAKMRSLYLKMDALDKEQAAGGADEDPGRDFILPLLHKQAVLQNNRDQPEFAYSAIDGFPVYEEGIVTVDVSEATREVVLATDGYPTLDTNLRDTERELAALLARDPLLVDKFKSTKGLTSGSESFDDRAYLRLRIAG